MVNYFSSEFKLGILGGGQLGKMMLYETRKLDIQTYVMDPNPQAPGRLACDHFTDGDLMDFDTVYSFGKKVDVLTFEIESVNVDALELLEKEGTKVYPEAATLRKIQNKGRQKQLYADRGIPTADFAVFATKVELVASIEQQDTKLPFVWKSTQGGYDGKGVAIIKSEKELAKLPDTECIAEALVPFKNELAVIVARNVSGEIKTYPVVEMEFHPEANQVEYVLCPARISDAIAKKAIDIATRVSQAFDHVGILAVELFLTQDDEILVNEVAPRPHNSGHYSIEASFTNQFEQHIRCILDLPLGATESKLAGIMVNLTGAEGFSGPVTYENIKEVMTLPGVTPHIYGKKETRPFRKMGHVTIVNKDINTARQIAEKVKDMLRVISK
ncbi:5-(carboxyamino)imidazole ribonucleotide synthase [Aquimarina intermedia]|uniref:N5-carboxyaminoimidazole ribonucleotide synthase n=1 Tax=Aquimarina intermedia TaxID=350814 RepID=A0A5S5C655_9FLAO|nr:5-(carboxyamino)imidazole ribonucleotide synthase [Aquimarina intermedia]TYP73453.1 5-(carboxyamino)imidazole ribonucleotide synthase [Aquimarina intermedia]